MEIVSLVIAFGSLALALYTYFKHDKELKAQQKFINTYEIEKIKKEVVVQKKADVRAYVIDVHGESVHTGTLVIKNHGQAPAYNIRVHRLSYYKGQCLPNPEISELLPKAQQEYSLRWPFYDGGEIPIRITWSDELNTNRQHDCHLQL